MKRIVLGIQYDGRPWQGWQSQPHGITVQDELEKAVQRIALHPVKVACAGRTDAGVHALEQIAHFDTEVDRPLSSWVRGVNAHLPDSIAVRWTAELAQTQAQELEFHSRFSALARTYHYVIYNHAVHSPILAGRAGWVFRELDAQAMHEAAQCLVGEHDFSAFRAISCQAKTPVKLMQSITIRRQGNLIICSLRASAFLHHMVRNIIGSLIAVGTGKQAPQWLAELLQSRDRSLAAPTFMADGLYLAQVSYDPKWALPQQVSVDNWFA